MILDAFDQFIGKILEKLDALGVDVSKLEMDHIGYQASSNEDYDRLKPEFNTLGKQVSEIIVGGRRVGIYLLSAPIKCKQYIIPAIELVAPKDGQVCSSALNHAEFVIPVGFDSFIQKYPNLPWDVSKTNQPMFPMIILKLDDDIQVKFHLKPVLEIVKEKI
jgi:predicted metalloenzyme YecM